MLSIITFVAPAISVELCRGIGAHWGRALGQETIVSEDHERSGPMAGSPDPFRSGRADVGWICAPSYLSLRDAPAPSVTLLGAAAVHDDPRNGDRPLYFSELVVHADAPYQRFEDLHEAHFVYNDDSSLSGKTCMLLRMMAGGHDVDMLASWTPSGAHSTSMQLVAEAQADCAAIDANVFRIAPDHVRRRLRVLETLGPYPAQPVVVRADLAEARRIALRDTLLALHTVDPDLLARHHVRRFAAVDDDHYRPLVAQIAGAEALLAGAGDGR